MVRRDQRFAFFAFFFFFGAVFFAALPADFFADDFLPALFDFLACFFGVTFFATLPAAFLAFLATVFAAAVVAPAAPLTTSVACSRIDFSSSMSSPRVVEAAPIPDSPTAA